MPFRFKSEHSTIATTVLCAALLTACGGGSSGGGDALPPASAESDSKATALAVSKQAKSTTAASTNATTTSTIILTAAATVAGGTGALVQLWSNGAVVGSVEVASGEYRDYTFTIAPVTPGQKIDVAYTNDATVNGVDRNLFVRSITVDGVVRPPSEATYDRGYGPAAFDGQEVIAGQEGMFWAGALRYTLPGNPNATNAPPGYYVDATSGNDGNLGTYDHPFKTLRRLNDVRLASGAGVYLKCGETWRESLALNWLQLVNGSIVAGYGDCTAKKAVITGADDFSGGWVRTGNAWMRSVPASTPKISRVFINGAPLRVAQWPNQTATSQGYGLAAPGSASSTERFQLGAAEIAALGGRDLRGATANMRTLPWVIESKVVDSYNAADASVRLAGPTQYPMDAGEGYIFQDKLWMLDVPGEFYHDMSTNVLYVYPTDAASQANMNLATVEGSVRDTVVALSNRSRMSVKDLSVQRGRANGLQMTDTEQATVEAVDAAHNGLAGIALYQWTPTTAGLTGITVTNSSLTGNQVHGIDARFVSGAQIKRNRISHTGTLATAAGSSAAIETGPGALVDQNVIDGSAYHGIRYSGAEFAKITRNSVSNYCKRLSDCGGIYTWNGPKGSARIAGQISTIEANQLGAAISDVEGVNGGMDHVVAGIYIDDFSRAITVKGNTVQGTPVGIFVHNASDMSVQENRFWLNADAGILASMDQTDQDYMQRNVFVDNQIVPFTVATGAQLSTPKFRSSLAVRFVHYLNGGSALNNGSNTFARNQVVRLNGTTIQAFAEVATAASSQTLNATQWALLNHLDGTPVSPLTFAVYNATLGNELVPPGGLNAPNGWGMYFANPGRGEARSGPTPEVTCSGVCITLNSATADDLLYSSAFPLSLNTTYVFSYNAAAPYPVTVRAPYISRFVTPWDSMASGGYVTLGGRSGSEIRYEAFFTAKATENSRVNLQLETFSVPVTFSGMSIRPVTSISYSKLTDWASVASTTALEGRTVDCADLGWPAGCQVSGPDGGAIALPATLAAGTQQLFLRRDSTWRR